MVVAFSSETCGASVVGSAASCCGMALASFLVNVPLTLVGAGDVGSACEVDRTESGFELVEGVPPSVGLAIAGNLGSAATAV